MEAASTAQPAAGQPGFGGQSPADAHAAGAPGAIEEHPEILVGAAFAGGLVLAGVLRWLGR